MEDTILTTAECEEIAKIMTQKYRAFLLERTISISVELDGDTVKTLVLLQNADETFYYPIEGRMLFRIEEMSANEAAMFLLDYADLYIEEFLLEDNETLLPIDWADYEYDAVKFQMRGQVINRKLEAEASALLNSHLN